MLRDMVMVAAMGGPTALISSFCFLTVLVIVSMYTRRVAIEFEYRTFLSVESVLILLFLIGMICVVLLTVAPERWADAAPGSYLRGFWNDWRSHAAYSFVGVPLAVIMGAIAAVIFAIYAYTTISQISWRIVIVLPLQFVFWAVLLAIFHFLPLTATG